MRYGSAHSQPRSHCPTYRYHATHSQAYRHRATRAQCDPDREAARDRNARSRDGHDTVHSLHPPTRRASSLAIGHIHWQ